MPKEEKVGWYHLLNEPDFEQAPGDGEGQESLACCNPWHTKSRTQLSNSSLMLCYFFLPSFLPLCFLYLGISMGLSSNLQILSSPRLNLSFSITSEIFIYHVMLQLQYSPCVFFLIIEPIFVDSLFTHVR